MYSTIQGNFCHRLIFVVIHAVDKFKTEGISNVKFIFDNSNVNVNTLLLCFLKLKTGLKPVTSGSSLAKKKLWGQK